MEYFYIQTDDGLVYGSFNTKAEALRYVNYAGFTCDWKLVDGADMEFNDEHNGNSHHTHLD